MVFATSWKGWKLSKFIFVISLLFFHQRSWARVGQIFKKPINVNQKEEYQGVTKYPIILHHGIVGFDQVLGIEYWNGIPKYLRTHGHQVFVTAVNPIGSIEETSKELSLFIDNVLKETGAKKVNLVAHSYGGVNARFMISNMGYGDKVASLSTVSTPHRGSIIADLLMEYIPGPTVLIAKILGYIVSGRWNYEPEPRIFKQLTRQHMMNNFNLQVQNSGNVYYQSWAGNSSITGFTTGDILLPIFKIPYKVLLLWEGKNDGLVSVNSAKWGKYRGIIPADHIDQMGHGFGLRSLFFKPKKFYLKMANELAEMGF